MTDTQAPETIIATSYWHGPVYYQRHRAKDGSELEYGETAYTLESTSNARIAELEAKVSRLLKNLEPFGALLKPHHDDLPDDRPIFAIESALITVGDLRRAAMQKV